MNLQLPDAKKAFEFFQNKMTFTLGPMELKTQMDEKNAFNIIDVRAADDFAKGHVPGAINLPKDQWVNLEALKKDQVNIIYCYSIVCHLAARAAVEFASKGFPVMELDGGFKSWTEHHLPIEGAKTADRQVASETVSAQQQH